jgi:hypothetical protein
MPDAPKARHIPALKPERDTPMKFVCLVYGEESQFGTMSKAEMGRLDTDSLAYDRSLQERGHLIVAEALQSVKTAKSVRRRGGRNLVTDGPFAETKEQLLGFVMIEAGDVDEALDIAGGIPLAATGTIEVRAVYDIPGS